MFVLTHGSLLGAEVVTLGFPRMSYGRHMSLGGFGKVWIVLLDLFMLFLNQDVS